MIAQTPKRRLDVENEHDVLVWRFRQLRAAGYEETEAAELAARGDIDLHDAVTLLEHGCPHELALEILF